MSIGQEKRSDELAKLAKEIKKAHKNFCRSLRATLDHAIRAGEALLQAKDLVGHGNFANWVSMHCQNIGLRQAEKYMKLARDRDKVEEAKANSNSNLAIDEMIRQLGKMNADGDGKDLDEIDPESPTAVADEHAGEIANGSQRPASETIPINAPARRAPAARKVSRATSSRAAARLHVDPDQDQDTEERSMEETLRIEANTLADEVQDLVRQRAERLCSEHAWPDDVEHVAELLLGYLTDELSAVDHAAAHP